VNDEGRDMWQVYLDMKEYAAALAHCRNPFQRDQVYLVQVMCNICLVLPLEYFQKLQFSWWTLWHNLSHLLSMIYSLYIVAFV